jgi:hypothetical protein
MGRYVISPVLPCRKANITGRINTNLTRVLSRSYSLSLPCSSTPYLTLSQQSRARSAFAFSWSTLVNLFLLYLLVSLAQQVQRLRTEVAFIGQETKDLRMYSSKVEELERRGRYGWEPAEYGSIPGEAGESGHTTVPSSAAQVGPSGEVGDCHWRYRTGQAQRAGEEGATSLGRVVMGQSGWEKWMSHPTYVTILLTLPTKQESANHMVRLVSLTRSLGWLWHTVVWLVHS